MIQKIEVDVDEIADAPSAAELFGYDAGVTTVQAAIAEAGTLMLEAKRERHRLVSLVPPAHVAIVEAARVCRTPGEALAAVSRGGFVRLSPAMTFITGPSRTADLELTLGYRSARTRRSCTLSSTTLPELLRSFMRSFER